ncbi:MAG: DNA-3-methyladenine glycosylase [Rickettsiales bacterium]|nr:DNA-3-methyladenine glycosylase [Rickettsiales bacterium]
MIRLGYDFFNRDTCTVAKELLGQKLFCNNKTGIIIETEAYIGENDPACHASRGRTPRTEVMYGKAGITYVYLIYGMYHCLNIVTENQGFPAAILIRGVVSEDNQLHDGPGKLCKYFDINIAHNITDITESSDLYIEQITKKDKIKFSSSPRIGISKGKDKLWRYILDTSTLLS